MPLHYAVEFNAPVDIIDSLLEIAPKALKKKTSKKAGGKMPLHYLIENINQCKFETFELFLKLYPKSATFRTAKGLLPLHIAVIKNARKPVFDLLIKKNPYACDLKTRQCKTLALRLAAEHNVDVGIRMLIWKNMDSDWIIDAIEGHLWKVVSKYLLEEHDRLNTKRKRDGYNPLHLAIKNGAPETTIVKMIALRPKSAKAPCKLHQQLPLHIACSNQEIPCVVIDALVNAYHESLTSPDKGGNIPLHTAIVHNMPVEIIARLIEHAPCTIEYKSKTKRSEKAVHIAVRAQSSLATLRFLIKKDPAKDEQIAALQQHFFPKWGPPIQRSKLDRTILRGNTPGGVYQNGMVLSWASGYKVLQDNRRFMRREDIGGWYPQTTIGGRLIVPFEGETKANDEDESETEDNEQKPQKVDTGGDPVKEPNDSMLHSAARWGHTEIVKLLLERGADQKSLNKNKDTPLHAAALNGHVDVVRILMNSNKKESIAWKNSQGFIPEQLAGEWPEVLHLFTRYNMVGWVA
eukprot:g2273.t1